MGFTNLTVHQSFGNRCLMIYLNRQVAVDKKGNLGRPCGRKTGRLATNTTVFGKHVLNTARRMQFYRDAR